MVAEFGIKEAAAATRIDFKSIRCFAAEASAKKIVPRADFADIPCAVDLPTVFSTRCRCADNWYD